MHFFEQIRARRLALGKTAADIARDLAMKLPNLYRLLTGKHDAKASTLAALAASLHSEWVLVPKHLLPEVNRLLSGKTLAPDNVPSAMERLLETSR
jgi:transcriptional regulator with XRE-family HTH domain